MNPRLEQNGSSFILKEELERLKTRTGIKTDFRVVWSPKADSKKDGEVVGNTIFVYSLDVDKALQTLQHEFVDIIVSSAIQPYLKLINVLLSTISEDAYKKKEKVVEMLLKLLVDDRPSS
jgi:galactitol-specific phosphotransferase system IIB component